MLVLLPSAVQACVNEAGGRVRLGPVDADARGRDILFVTAALS